MLRPLGAAAFAAALLIGSAGASWADPDDVTAGMLRAVVSSQGTPLRAEARKSSAVLGQIPHAARLTVLEVATPAGPTGPKWLRVTTEVAQADGTKASKTGWLLSSSTVQPYVLSGAGRGGTAESGGTATPQNVAAAGRGFDEGIERALAQSNAAMAANLVHVDRLERTKPTLEDVAVFAKEGRLGFPGRVR